MRQEDNKINLKFISFLFTALFFLSFFYSCETVKTKYVGVDSLNVNYSNDSVKAVVKIIGLILKDGKFINLEEKNPEIDIKKKEIVFEESENVSSIKYFEEISSVKIKIVKAPAGPDGFGATLIIAIGLLITLMLISGGKFWQ